MDLRPRLPALLLAGVQDALKERKLGARSSCDRKGLEEDQSERTRGRSLLCADGGSRSCRGRHVLRGAFQKIRPELVAPRLGPEDAFPVLVVVEGIPPAPVSYTHLRAHETD